MRRLVADLCSDQPHYYTPTDVLELIRWLPDDSAFAASHAGGTQHRGWSTSRYLAKALFDAIQIQTYVNMRIAAGKKGRSIQQPKPFPTPDDYQQVEKRKPSTSVAALAALPIQKG